MLNMTEDSYQYVMGRWDLEQTKVYPEDLKHAREHTSIDSVIIYLPMSIEI